MKNKLIISLFCSLLPWIAGAQQTGSFDDQITFMGQSRTLSCYVPVNYNASNEYRLMIGLHGLGDNSVNYRNALINALTWQKNFPNTIFIFPDGGSDPNSDFYAPAGDEGIIAEAMEYALQNYSIDSSFIVLQGFSLGGRSAAKYGLENPGQFKGLLLNTPAFQGKSDVDNNPASSLMYNYANASQIPVYITVGDQDLYYYILESMVKKLKKINTRIAYLPVTGMGHNVPDSTRIAPAFPFFEDPARADYDIDLFDIDMPQHTCDASIFPVCFVQNTGAAAVTSLQINYQFAGGSGSYTWTGNIGAYDHAQISLPAMNTANGEQELILSIGLVNGSQTDTATANNQLSAFTEVHLQGVPLQVSEGFEGNSPGWVFKDTETLFQWYRDTDVKKTGQASVANFNTILLFYTVGNVESFESPVVDLTTSSDPVLTYDIAYNYHKYTPPYVTADTVFADTLEIVISTDCGQSWHSLYKKGGTDLATAASPMLNPLNLNQIFFQPTASQWRKDTIDLAAFANETEAILRFNYISGNGGSVYIDNISVGDARMNITERHIATLELYPNPARDRITLSTGGRRISRIRIYDMAGNEVLQQDVSNFNDAETEILLPDLPAGLYQVEMKDGRHSEYRKLMIAE